MIDRVIHDNAPQDRFVGEIYAWICIDPKTGLEGIASLLSPMSVQAPMQAITSSLDTARRMGDLYRILAKETGKQFQLVRFERAEIIDSFK